MDDEIRKKHGLFRVKQNAIRMMMKRGYDIDETDRSYLSDGSYEDFMEKFALFERDTDALKILHETGEKSTAFVAGKLYYRSNTKENQEIMRNASNIETSLRERWIKTTQKVYMFFIYPTDEGKRITETSFKLYNNKAIKKKFYTTNINDGRMKYIVVSFGAMNDFNPDVEIISSNVLKSDLNHVFQPHMELVKDKSTIVWPKGVTEFNLPYIYTNDPFCVVNKLFVRDIVRITRSNIFSKGLDDISVEYRIVIQNQKL